MDYQGPQHWWYALLPLFIWFVNYVFDRNLKKKFLLFFPLFFSWFPKKCSRQISSFFLIATISFLFNADVLCWELFFCNIVFILFFLGCRFVEFSQRTMDNLFRELNDGKLIWERYLMRKFTGKKEGIERLISPTLFVLVRLYDNWLKSVIQLLAELYICVYFDINFLFIVLFYGPQNMTIPPNKQRVVRSNKSKGGSVLIKMSNRKKKLFWWRCLSAAFEIFWRFFSLSLTFIHNFHLYS